MLRLNENVPHSKMWRPSFVVCFCVLQAAFGVKVRVLVHSDEADSKMEETEARTEAWDHKRPVTMLPFLKKTVKHEDRENEEETRRDDTRRDETRRDETRRDETRRDETRRDETRRDEIRREETRRDEKPTTEKPVTPLHPNEVLFPLIYKQSHINSMFMFGQNWYTWSTEKRTDGTKAINYYICYEEPKHCDDVGWERTDSLPKCAFQIDSLMSDDRACLNAFGIEPHNVGGCDGGEQMKVSEIVHSCGPRIRSLWRFVRVGHRPANAAKPADVNSLICEDEEECVINVEYRIHHDRITFSLHEPTRGQTFKSALKRDLTTEDENKLSTITESHIHVTHKKKKEEEHQANNSRYKKFHVKARTKTVEGKGVTKERNDSGYNNRRSGKNKIKVREDISDDTSE